MIESLLLTAVHVLTFGGERLLTNASCFFFERGGRLFPVTSRHVMADEEPGISPTAPRSNCISTRTILPSPRVELDQALGLNYAW